MLAQPNFAVESVSKNRDDAKPFLKWAGGKTQIIGEILDRAPTNFNKYIEPFLGGGAVFFSLNARKSVISDSNPELINVYKQVGKAVEDVIYHLRPMKNDENFFYEIRAEDFANLEPSLAAARTIFLNRTCFNGLYRVNRRGQFNTPFGKYKNPKICNEELLRNASLALRHATILTADFREVLREFAEEGDFVYLDPPYLPISKYSDFKRYTKEQFSVKDHRDLSAEVERLASIGCNVLISNSNHPLVDELYGMHSIELIGTRRNVSARGDKRTSVDTIVSVSPRSSFKSVAVDRDKLKEPKDYPPTRFMGSKEKLVPVLAEVTQGLKFETVADLFSGSGVVSYLFKTLGKSVVANDYMAMNSTFAKAMVENETVHLEADEIEALFNEPKDYDRFVSHHFSGLYFGSQDCQTIDIIRANIKRIDDPYKNSIAMSALMRACLKKRPRGVFTYTGIRYDDGRIDLRTSIQDHIRAATRQINHAVFSNGKHNRSILGDALDLNSDADLVYMDPPYFSPLSDNEYVRRYHFLEGLARDWKDVEMQWHTKTKKFKNFPTPFKTREGTYQAFDYLFKKFRDRIIIVSYASNALPSREELTSLLKKYKSKVEVLKIDHTYSFGSQRENEKQKNNVTEYLFIGT